MTELMTADPVEDDDIERRLERHRPTLKAHCRRLLGSAFDADDAVQETMVRAWRSFHRFEGRSSLQSWLRRIATNVCFDLLNARQRRPRPTDSGAWALEGPAVRRPGRRAAEGAPPEPVAGADPADRAVERDDVRLAFVAALLHLPPRQRSVLLLCEVLRWRATEAAELLDMSVASVNSALQRARTTLAEHHGRPPRPERLRALDADQRATVQHLTDAFQRYDHLTLLALLG